MAIVNCELSTKNVEVAIGTSKYKLALPYITNTKAVDDEVELVCLSISSEPVQKKPRLEDDVAVAKPKAKAKAKANAPKGKSKGKGKGRK